MRILIVEDEEGIREGLASFLRHHGHVVHTAASCAAARAVRDSQVLDVMVTDWRLTDGNAGGLLDTELPALVITGCPEEIDAGHAVVLRKPVLPMALLDELARCVRAPASGTRPAPGGDLAGLPVDTQDRVRLVLAEFAADDVEIEIDDDGTFVTVSFRTGSPAAAGAVMAHLGGDWRLDSTVDGAGARRVGTRVRWRGYRDGRPAGVAHVIAPDAVWPDTGAFAIDLHDRPMTTEALTALLAGVAQARAIGREVHLLNVPGHLRLFLELTGRAHELPMRTCTGPRLPAHQRQLW